MPQVINVKRDLITGGGSPAEEVTPKRVSPRSQAAYMLFDIDAKEAFEEPHGVRCRRRHFRTPSC